MKRILGLALGSVLCMAVVGAAVAADANYTVGDFAVNLAKMVTHRADFTPEAAAAYLEELGVELEGDLSSPVSEAEFVEALNQLGLNLTTSNPQREVAEPHADQVFQLFDRSDTLFSSELFKLCQDAGQLSNTPCVTDADCIGPGGDGFCEIVPSIVCIGGGPNNGQNCVSNADCPGGRCKIPPGIDKKLDRSSPIDGD